MSHRVRLPFVRTARAARSGEEMTPQRVADALLGEESMTRGVEMTKATIRMPVTLHQRLRILAIKRGVAFERLFVELAEKGLAAERSKKGK